MYKAGPAAAQVLAGRAEKPDPGIFLRACQLAGCQPHEVRHARRLAFCHVVPEPPCCTLNPGRRACDLHIHSAGQWSCFAAAKLLKTWVGGSATPAAALGAMIPEIHACDSRGDAV